MEAAWGGDLAAEAAAAAEMVQRATDLCLTLAADLETAAGSLDKTMSAGEMQKGISLIKAGDSTPVSAADFAIQGLVSEALAQSFPQDRFMGEEDAESLREDGDLRAMAWSLAARFGAKSDVDTFLMNVDRGLEPSRGKGERVWILDPIDGTKGFLTGQGYIIGLALVDQDGVPLVAAMGNPRRHPAPCVMVAVKGAGLRYWPARGAGPVERALGPADQARRDRWVGKAFAAPWVPPCPPWLVSRPMAAGSPMPFGPRGAPDDVCCGAMVKYWAVAEGSCAGFIQYEESLKSWDHACGVLCVIESGGKCVDGSDAAVVFPEREFKVDRGIVCSAAEASAPIHTALVDSVKAERRQK